MAARAQMEQVKPQEFRIKNKKSTEDPLVVKQSLFHASDKSDHLQLRPEVAILLQFLSCLGDVTSRNIRL